MQTELFGSSQELDNFAVENGDHKSDHDSEVSVYKCCTGTARLLKPG